MLLHATLRQVNIGITCYPTYGGSGIVATELGLELATRGHDVHFITYANPIRLDPGHPAHPLPRGGSLQLPAVPISALLPGARLAHGRGGGGLLARPAARALRHPAFHLRDAGAADDGAHSAALPFITTLHGTDITLVGVDRSYFPITKFSIEKSDGITSISEYLRKQTVEVFGVTNEIRVIHNFVNCDLYQPDDARRTAPPYAPDGEKLLIHLSNFRPVKRVLDCIRILAEVRQAGSRRTC